MPPGTDPSTVTVTPIVVADFADDLSGGQLLSAYRLEPEGLHLSSPATLKVTLDPTAVQELIGHHAGAGGDEILRLEVAERTSSTLALTATISHFSIVAFENSPVQRIETLMPPRDAFQGQLVEVRYRLTPRLMADNEYLKSRPGDGLVLPGASAMAETWNVTTWDSVDNSAGVDILAGVARSPIEPPSQSAADMPMDPSMPGLTTNFRDFDFVFQCTGVGPYGMTFEGNVGVDAMDTYAVQTNPDGTPMNILHCDEGACCFPGAGPCGGACNSDADCMNMTTISQMLAVTVGEHGSQDSASCLMPRADPTGDFIDSISTNAPAFTGAQVDIVASGFTLATYTQMQVDAAFNGADSPYACGHSDATRTVACPDGGATPMPAGQIDTFFMKLAGPVPISDAAKRYIYSVVLDSDGDPTTDWVAQPPYDYDYFQGADRWYQAMSDRAAGTWSVTTTQVDASQATTTVPSSARAVIEGDAITWFIPASELPSPTGYRVTAYGDDGMYTPSSRGGDVSGANPTAALTAFP